VPQDAPWDPGLAYNFTSQLASNFGHLLLSIRAVANQIIWSLDVPDQFEEGAKRTLYAFYPQCQVEPAPWLSTYTGYRQYDIQAANSFVLPLRYVDEFSQLDPLASVVNAMAGLAGDEEIVYQLALLRPNRDYHKEARRLFVPSIWQSIVQGVFEGILKPYPRTQESLQAEQEIKAIVEEKLAYGPLMEATLALKVKAQSEARADNLANLVATAFSQFNTELNRLVGAQRKTHHLVLSPREIAALWHLPTEHCRVPGVIWADDRPSILPAPLLQDANQDGIVLGTNTHRGRAYQVRLGYPDRRHHVNIVGKTGMGKSTLIARMVHQDIAAGKGVGVIDPHGDLVEEILAASIPDERVPDVVLFDLADYDYPIGLNLLVVPAGLSLDAAAGQIVDALRKMFDYWSERIEQTLYASVRALLTWKGATIEDIPRLLSDDDFRAQVLAQVDREYDPTFWHYRYNRLAESKRLEWTEGADPRISKLYRTRIIKRIMCQSSSLDFRGLMDQGKIFLASLGAGSEVSESDKETLGTMLVSKFQMAVMSRADIPQAEDRVPFYLYIDEVQKFANTDSLPMMFEESRKYGLNLAVGNQHLRQLEGKTRDAIMGTVGTSIIFRVGPKDGEILSSLAGAQFSGDDLVNLDKATTVVKMQTGGQTVDAFRMSTLAPLPRSKDAAARVLRIRQHSRAIYARSAGQVDEELRQRHRLGEPPPEPPEPVKRDILVDDDTDTGGDWRDALTD
jgi:hypothetical protein